MFRFADPLFLLFALPVLAFLLPKFRRSREPSLLFSGLANARQVPRGFRVRLSRAPRLAMLLGLLLFVVALARPQAGAYQREILSEGVDILLALDVSSSMAAEDFKPKNRLHVAKQVVSDFIDGRESDRLGLVIFSRYGFTRCPLTLDYAVLKRLLDDVVTVRPGGPDDGTAIGSAIAGCVNRLKESEAKSKVIVLLTDGVNNSGEIDPETAAEIARSYGIKIYTIGAGGRGMTRVPVVDQVTGRKTYARMKVEIDEELLKRVADSTEGRFYRATDAESLARIYEEIGTLEKTEVKSRQFVEYRELFFRFLSGGLLLFAVGAMLSTVWLRTLP